MSTSVSPGLRWRRPEAAPVRCEPVVDDAALERLAPEWERLWQRARASPFLSPAWLLPWWRHVGRGTLASVAVRSPQDGELVGFAPLYVYRAPDTGRRHLFPLGIATSDRLDLLVDAGWRAAVVQALSAHLREHDEEWDLLEVPQLPADAHWLAVPWNARLRCEVQAGDPNPVLALPARLAASVSRDLAYCRRRAARAGIVACEQADASTLHALLASLERLHGKRWALRGQAGVLRHEGVMDWHREAAPRLLAADLLRLLALRLDGAVAAVLYGLVDPPIAAPRRWSYYLGGFDPDAAALSPGKLLVGHAIDSATAEGAALFDFLRGDEAYKARWGAVAEPMFRLRVERP